MPDIIYTHTHTHTDINQTHKHKSNQYTGNLIWHTMQNSSERHGERKDSVGMTVSVCMSMQENQSSRYETCALAVTPLPTWSQQIGQRKAENHCFGQTVKPARSPLLALKFLKGFEISEAPWMGCISDEVEVSNWLEPTALYVCIGSSSDLISGTSSSSPSSCFISIITAPPSELMGGTSQYIARTTNWSSTHNRHMKIWECRGERQECPQIFL